MTLQRASAGTRASDLAPVFADLGVDASELRAEARPGHVWLELPAALSPGDSAARTALETLGTRLGEDSTLLLGLALGPAGPGEPDDRRLAAWRDALWPAVHVFAIYRSGPNGILRQTLQGSSSVAGVLPFAGVILAGRRRAHVMSPSATVEKFDANAKGWDGEPGRPGYAHFRWMRRHVSLFGAPERAQRILDFGCGAGWVGIEAALAHPGAELCAFDPSPEMVKIAESNARAAGIERFCGRTGFGEDPPFPAEGEEPFDWVLSSGVLSFSPDLERWVDGVARAVAPGGTLVVGDIHRESRGFKTRRASKPLLPVRELNARTREEIVPMLEARGFRAQGSCSYQLTRPVPEAMHVSETRLFGLLSPPLLWLNRAAAYLDRRLGSPARNQFDSWIVHFVRDIP